jgi:hypothetical protein
MVMVNAGSLVTTQLTSGKGHSDLNLNFRQLERVYRTLMVTQYRLSLIMNAEAKHSRLTLQQLEQFWQEQQPSVNGHNMGKLIVKKEFLESEVHYDHLGSSRKVLLKDATQEQLAQIKEIEPLYFEKTEKEVKPEK